MTMPSPFQVGSAIGSNLSGVARNQYYKSRLDELLNKYAPNQGQYQDAMQRLLSEFPEDIQAQGMKRLEPMRQQQTGAALSQITGYPPEIMAALPPELQKIALTGSYKGPTGKDAAKQQNLLGATNTLNRMKELLEKRTVGPKMSRPGTTSRKWGSTFSGEGVKDRAEYERLGKSLISFATAIPIRNRLEFETLANSMYDYGQPIEALKGNVEAMERIINNSLGIYGAPSTQNQSPSQPQQMQAAAQQQNQALDAEIDYFIQQAGGDVDKAMMLYNQKYGNQG